MFCSNGVYDGYGTHFTECSMRNKIIEIYQLKGDKTDEEWAEYSKTLKNNNESEILFEKEYLEWKSNQIEPVKIFIQKKYAPFYPK